MSIATATSRPAGIPLPARKGMAAARRLKMVKVADLKTSVVIQRSLNWGWIESKKKEFRWAGIGVLEVDQLPNGDLYLTDGQHRAALVREVWGEQTEVPCMVGQIQDLEEQAQRFLDLNSRTQQRPQKLFHVKRVQGDLAVIDICKIVQQAGFVVKGDEDPLPRQWFEINQTSCLELIYRLRSGAGLLETLKLIERCWAGDLKATRAEYIKGVADFVARYQKHRAWSTAAVAEKLALYCPAEVLQSAKELAAECPSYSGVRLISLALLTLYNRGKRPVHKLSAIPDGVLPTATFEPVAGAPKVAVASITHVP